MHGYMEGRYAAVWPSLNLLKGRRACERLSRNSYIAQQDKEGLILS